MKMIPLIHNKSEEPINYPVGNSSAHFKRYIQIAISSGNLNMPVYESKLVNSNKGEKMSFNAGDTVQLKSGGEIMTIEEVDDDSATCIWFDNKKVERHTFLLITLKIVE